MGFGAAWRRRLVFANFLLLLLASSLEASWFSESTEVDGEKIDDARTIFDLTISLHSSPVGDDDPSVNGPGEEQPVYEGIIRHFADAVCEQSNGRHRLGEVRVFRSGAFSDRADVIWNASEWPRAHPAGFGFDGQHIIFGDVFPNGRGPGSDFNFLLDVQRAGYTLGHEWGHYVYGLYDEYRGRDPQEMRLQFPQTDDTPPEPSIMHSQWRAVNEGFQWLNHSTEDNFEPITAQGRVYGASGWDVLLRDPTQDPRDGARDGLPERIRYTSLSGAEPTAADGWVRTQLPGERTTCRQNLDIRWMADADLELQVVIDRSGSMSGMPIDNAKTAASNLVQVVPGGQTALGSVIFSGSPATLFPITPIPDPGAAVRDQLQAAIDGIGAGGTTALFDGADLALDGLEQYRTDNGTTANRAVFLLTDGADNSSFNTENGIVAAYNAADVPLITFGYGGFSPDGVLRRLADGTGGQFFAAPTTLPEIQAAFLSAITSVSSSVTIGALNSSAPPFGLSTVGQFQVDSTLSSVSIVATFEGSSLGLEVLDPSGAVAGALDCSATGLLSSCTATLDEQDLAAAGTGAYRIQASNGGGLAVPVEATVIGTPGDERTFDLAVNSASGATVEYPEPIIITAAVSRGRLITGVTVEALVTTPQGDTFVLPMRDDGLAPDGRAGDGVYTISGGYDADGTYSLEIIARHTDGGIFADAGYLGAPAMNGQDPVPVPPAAVGEAFERRARLQVTVEGVLFDDHPDSPPLGTAVDAANVDVLGRIDRDGDRDVFSVRALLGGDLVVRTSDLALGANPQLTVYAEDGSTVLGAATLATHRTVGGYVALRLPAATIGSSSRLFAEVRQLGAPAGGATYTLSAGPPLSSDEPAPGGSCQPTAERLCLQGGRFSVEAEWTDFDGGSGVGRASTLTPDTGFLWFFSPENIEIVVKVLDGRGFNGRYWVFFGSLSNVEYSLKVTDTLTGAVKTYFNPAGQFASVADTEAFDPMGSPIVVEERVGASTRSAKRVAVSTVAAGNLKQNCTASSTALCLLGDRFRASVNWRTQDDSGVGQAGSLTSESGYFWFFDPDNVELVVKVLDGRAFNGQYWVFFASLTNQEFELEVIDTENGNLASYFNALGSLASVGDTTALPGD